MGETQRIISEAKPVNVSLAKTIGGMEAAAEPPGTGSRRVLARLTFSGDSKALA